MKARTLTIEERLQISKEYKEGKTAPELSKKHRCSMNQVYDIAKKYGGRYKLNEEVSISDKQHQILLGGFLGDGRFRVNGSENVYYSECHALGEVDYLNWKHTMLGDLTKDSKIYDKNANNDHGKAKEFTSKTTPSLIKYMSYTKIEAIRELDELGLLIHLLDDGWLRVNSKTSGNFAITTYTWSEDERTQLINQWKKVVGVNFKESGIKRVNISVGKDDSGIIYELAKKHIPMNLDICKKKFRVFT